MVEGLTLGAAAKHQRYLKLAAICPDLFEPSEAARRMLTPQLRLDMVHNAVTLATKAYDRLHGVRSTASRRAPWMERDFQLAESTPYLVSPVSQGREQAPTEDGVLEEFRHALNLVAGQPQPERDRDFDRLLQYWYGQPNGPIKRATGELLLGFVRNHSLDREFVRGIHQPREEFLLRALKAG
jgi:hypothetical protein